MPDAARSLQIQAAGSAKYGKKKVKSKNRRVKLVNLPRYRTLESGPFQRLTNHSLNIAAFFWLMTTGSGNAGFMVSCNLPFSMFLKAAHALK